jgi:hypothetical protein
MFQVLNPVWLWGLSGTLIPLAIHLLSRKQGPVIKIGSVRHLSESTTSSFRSFRLNEVWLLIVRILLILLLSLLLADVRVNLPLSKTKSFWALIEQGLEASLSTVLDSLQNNGYELRYLATDFPTIKTQLSKHQPDYYKLINELKEKHLENIIVFASNRIGNFIGPAEFLPTHIQWVSISPSETSFNQFSVLASADSVSLRKGFSNEIETYFETVNVENNTTYSPTLPDTITLALYAAPGFEEDKRIMMAVLATINKHTPHHLTIKPLQSIDGIEFANYDWVINLSDEINGQNISDKSISYQDTLARVIIQVKKNKWLLTQRLNFENAIQQNLTVQFMQLLFSDDAQQDCRVMPENFRWKISDGTTHATLTELNSLADWIAFLFMALLITERLLAWKRKQ